ncbi:hypothetical protein [Ancylobacter polymorphus]|uniref:Uncharacterized protein n=1 Tax=Ancylobacter polymorphus TaxID=223390 RepID=A0ABU0BJW1_9HYPH|nr:hypothetical protein [Ancylobacter polymorphus]MDQ0305317.1 hypothetical protein [Ancylobacter polymorphus]
MLKFIRSLFSTPASSAPLVELADVKRLDVKPGDVIVITSRRPISREMAARLREDIGRFLPQQKVLIVDQGFMVDAVLGTEAVPHVH